MSASAAALFKQILNAMCKRNGVIVDISTTNYPYWWVDPHGTLVGTTTDTNPNFDQGFKRLQMNNNE
jgi:hypothetical protein